MALALLELTKTAAGDVLEQLLVTTEEAAADRERALGDVFNQVRAYAQLASEFPGVPRSVRVQLDYAAWASVQQYVQRRRTQRALSAPFMALWHHGQLQELHSRSLAEGFAVWQRQAGRDDNYVFIEISDLASRGGEYSGPSLEQLFAGLQQSLSDRLAVVDGPAKKTEATSVALTDAATRLTSTLTPAQQILRDAAAQRQALAAQWLTAAQVSADLGSQAANGSHRASQLRRDGQLLGVYVSHPSPSYRYPTWQFHRPGEVVYVLPEILRVLREYGPFERESEGLRRTTGWGEVEWFLSPHALLDGATPADMLATDPDRVLQAARTEFEDQI